MYYPLVKDTIRLYVLLSKKMQRLVKLPTANFAWQRVFGMNMQYLQFDSNSSCGNVIPFCERCLY